MPQLLVLGEYKPEDRTGPAIWLRCAIDRALESPRLPEEITPIVYLPEVGRHNLDATQCPAHLKPLVELQYRGVCWTQKNGKDWTVEAFLVSKNGGLGLDVAQDAATRGAMLRALTELTSTSVKALQNRRLEAEDFDRLFTDDLRRDVLVWMSGPRTTKSRWENERWGAFVARCKEDFNFDPERDGEIVAAEQLGARDGPWQSVWDRFAESPKLYPGIPDLLDKVMPAGLPNVKSSSPQYDLFPERGIWPRHNKEDEDRLRTALCQLTDTPPAQARAKIGELENTHGIRRGLVWAELNRAPLADALDHLAKIAELTVNELGGATVADMARLYEEEAWQVDASALSAMAAVKSSADAQAVGLALNAVYRPWLEAAAHHLQALAEKEPLPVHSEQSLGDVCVKSSGSLIFFVDGLRFDISQRLVEGLRADGGTVTTSTRWAGLPTVTATAKPAVSPVAHQIVGSSPGEDFLPVTADSGQPLTTDRFRQLLLAEGYQYINAKETGDPSGRAWTEEGKLDKLGHSEQEKLAARVDEQVELLIERINGLLDAGWLEIRVVTDHGWLWLPPGLPKVELPKYLTMSRWARCASIALGANVETPTVRWYWNAHERIAVAPGIACFGAGNKYAHGGLSLQESLIPVIRISSGAASVSSRAGIADISWVGLRCRVRIDSDLSGLSVALRTRVNDDKSSVSKARMVDDKGTTSLLVPDDELEGESAAVVVLDTAGQVIARQSTIIGGESETGT